ncbi:aspartate 1-decarboxylase [Arcanobacterium hippocoleae]
MTNRMRQMVTGKIHRATVTGADLHYVGSITIDQTLLQAADIIPGERVDVVNVNNGNRLSTYAIPGEPGKGEIVLNGAAAHLVSSGDLVIIMCYGILDDAAARTHAPKVVFVDAENKIVEVSDQPGIVPEIEPYKLNQEQAAQNNRLKSSGIPINRG